MRKSTILAALIFVVLLAGVWMTMGERPERGITRISFEGVDPQSITRIVTSGKHAVELKKDGDTWRLPDGKRADGAGVTRLVESIPKVKSANVVTEGEKRFADLEVDDQKGLHVKAYAGDKEVADFVIGKASRSGVDVRVGDSVYAVRGIVPSVFDRDASAWIEKTIFRVENDDVTKVEVALANGTKYTLVRSGNDWALEDPSILPAGFRFDANQARTLANSVIHARAKNVLDADPGNEKTGLAGSTDTFSLVTKDGKKLNLTLGGPTDEKDVYAKADGWEEVLTLYPQSERALRKSPADMRDLSLMKVDVDAAKRLEIENGKERLVFAKEGGAWKIDSSSEPAPEGFQFDPMKVQQRLVTLASSKAVAQAPESGKDGLAKPSASVRAVLEDGSSAVLAFGADTQSDGRDVVFARGNADDETYVVTQFTRDDMTRGLDSFARSEESAGMAGMPAGIDPAALANLPPDVREKLLKQLQQDRLKQQALKNVQVQAQ